MVSVFSALIFTFFRAFGGEITVKIGFFTVLKRTKRALCFSKILHLHTSPIHTPYIPRIYPVVTLWLIVGQKFPDRNGSSNFISVLVRNSTTNLLNLKYK